MTEKEDTKKMYSFHSFFLYTVKLVDCFQTSKRTHIVTELCKGKDLWEYLVAQSKSRIPTNETHVAHIFYQIGNIVSNI